MMMRGNISKKMVKKMKKKESLESKPGGSKLALELKRKERKREKMVVMFSYKGKIIFTKMDKF